MRAASYSVVCDLSLRNFDDPREGHAAAKGAFTEVRKLGRLDPRVRSTRLRRRRGGIMQISMTVSAKSAWEAFDLGRAMVRAGIHANGGSTEGWEVVQPQVAPTRSGAAGRISTGAIPTHLVHALSWEESAAAARRQAAPATALPPLTSSVGATTSPVIDLR